MPGNFAQNSRRFAKLANKYRDDQPLSKNLAERLAEIVETAQARGHRPGHT